MKILPGESVSSWLVRYILSDYRTTVQANDLLSSIKCMLRDVEDTDDPANSLFQNADSLVSQALGDQVFLKSPNFWYQIDSYRKNWFCPYCLINDLNIFKETYWRTSWSNGYYVVCIRHKFPLVNLREPIQSFECFMGRSVEALNYAFQGPWYDTFDEVNQEHGECGELLMYAKKIAINGQLVGRSAVNYALVNMAWICQKHIGLLLWQSENYKGCVGNEANGYLSIMYLLLALAMRKYIPRVERKTLVLQLSEFQGGMKEQGSSLLHTSTYLVDEGINTISSVPKKIAALAIVARIMELEGVEQWWSHLVAASKEFGVFFPETPEEIYKDLTYSELFPLDQWFRSRLTTDMSQMLIDFLKRTILDQPLQQPTR